MTKDKTPSKDTLETQRISRRDFVRKSLYASPVLLTLPATPSFAQQGSAAAAGGACPAGQVNLCEVTNLCEIPASEGGLIAPDGIVCAS